jgi:thiosulfate/3-mercaptopyruvate sulfurtransferase
MTMTTLIAADDLAARLDNPGVRVFDVRHDLVDHELGKREYEQSHIAGAQWLDVEHGLAGKRTGSNGRHPLPDRATFAAIMAAYGVGPHTLVVAYDASGGTYAARLWWMLRWIGHERVAVLDGGWQAWQAAGLPVEASAPRKPALAEQGDGGLGQGGPLAEPVDAQTVLRNIDHPSFTVVDARAGARYRGENEPIDPVAGHIPGALNRPSSDNIGADGRFKAPAQLREEFLAVIGDRPPETIVHQCGSGITAAHNLLAMEVAGLTGSRLYAGSWSEWVADPARPVAKGAA